MYITLRVWRVFFLNPAAFVPFPAQVDGWRTTMLSSLPLFTSMLYWVSDKSSAFPLSPDRTSVSIREYYWCAAVSVCLPPSLDSWKEESRVQSATLYTSESVVSFCSGPCAAKQVIHWMFKPYVSISHAFLKKLFIFFSFTTNCRRLEVATYWQSEVIYDDFMMCWQSA